VIAISKKWANKILPSTHFQDPIGFTEFTLVDATRKDLFTTSRLRQFKVLVWYPGEKAEHAPYKKYLEIKSNRGVILSSLSGMIGLRKQSGTNTNSLKDIPVSDRRPQYPVLIFSHDLGLLPEYYTTLAESLAGEGYIVFSINHTYFSEHSCFDVQPGSVRFRARYRGGIKALWALRRKGRRNLADDDFNPSGFLNVNSEMISDRRFLLDFLEELNKGKFLLDPAINRFIGRLNLNRVGAIGHGWGGSSAAHSLVNDTRIKTAVSLNGRELTQRIESTSEKPLLVICADGTTDLAKCVEKENLVVVIPDSTHRSFTDLFKVQRNGAVIFWETLNHITTFFNSH
jgi:hypothetical protein